MTTLAPWLSVRRAIEAVEFYKSAFAASEVFRIQDGESVVARLSIDGGEFWVSDESPEHHNFSPETVGGGTVRMVLTVDDPKAVHASARAAGANEINAVHEEHGWLVGRVIDPYGHHWEIGRELQG